MSHGPMLEIEMEDRSATAGTPSHRLVELPKDEETTLCFRGLARVKRRSALERCFGAESYYGDLVRHSHSRTDLASAKDRKQIDKDLPRTFQSLPPVPGGKSEALQPVVKRLLLAFIERGRKLSAMTFRQLGQQDQHGATTSRGLLEGYPQGLNFLAGMSLLCVLGSEWEYLDLGLEESAFWLLALLLEDVLDADWFGADVGGNVQMAYIGGLAIKTLILELSKEHCPALRELLGPDAYESGCGAVLDRWVLSLFVGCVPPRLQTALWKRLLLGSGALPANDAWVAISREAASGLVPLIAFSLAALSCASDKAQSCYAASWEGLRLRKLAGLDSEELILESAELTRGLQEALVNWPAGEDDAFFARVDELEHHLLRSLGTLHLKEEVRRRKQRIIDCAGNQDEQLRTLTQRTHFTVEEIRELKRELDRLQSRASRGSTTKTASRICIRLKPIEEDDRLPGTFGGNLQDGLSLEAFTELVARIVPEFPSELVGRLFKKLDVFAVGQLAFAQLACGMSVLALGSMDEKLQVCFDIFDSEHRRALSLKDVCDLCTVLFRVALAQGFEEARRACTDDALVSHHSSFEGADLEAEQSFRRLSRLSSPLATATFSPFPTSTAATATSATASTSASAPPPPATTGTTTTKTTTTTNATNNNTTSSSSSSSSFLNPNSAISTGGMTRARTGGHGPGSGQRTSLDSRMIETSSPSQATDAAPWRSAHLRLLAAATVRTPGGPRLVDFEGFRNALRSEPAMLGLFSWCLPRPPDLAGCSISSSFHSFKKEDSREAERCTHLCGCVTKLLAGG